MGKGLGIINELLVFVPQTRSSGLHIFNAEQGWIQDFQMEGGGGGSRLHVCTFSTHHKRKEQSPFRRGPSGPWMLLGFKCSLMVSEPYFEAL